jgi:hypothetical protein
MKQQSSLLVLLDSVIVSKTPNKKELIALDKIMLFLSQKRVALLQKHGVSRESETP